MYTITVPDVDPSTQNLVAVSTQPILTSILTQTYGADFKWHHLSQTHATYPEESYRVTHPETIAPPFSQFLTTIASAFNFHIPLALSPEVLWYIICHEVAIHIKHHPADYASLFNGDPQQKKQIAVQDDNLIYGSEHNDWHHTLQLFNYALRQELPEQTHRVFLPPFSTLTLESETALLISLMDQASSYYKYRFISLCGIPSIRLEGSANDWELLEKQTGELAGMFTGLRAYFQDLLGVLSNLKHAARGETFAEEASFWKSLYKIDNNSGGPYITGWITAFFAYTTTDTGFALKKAFNWRALVNKPMGGYKMNQFPAHLSLVPSEWNYRGRTVNTGFLAGVLGNEYREGFLAPRLGYGVVEFAAN